MPVVHRNVFVVLCLLPFLSFRVFADVADDNRQVGIAFLQENSTKEGVQVTPSGLQYIAVREGSGASPSKTDRVTVNYKGSNLDGKEFDSSSAMSFSLNRVIRGWTEGLQLMKEGAKYRFYIPSDLAYGERGAGGTIGPNEVLVFDVELLSVNQP